MSIKSKQVQGATIRVTDTGRQASPRPAILLVHGFPFNHAMWNKQIDVLSQHARVICPDLPGFGDSVNNAPGEMSLRQLADDLAGLLNELAVEKVIYCGLSMGGYIGWQFWKHHANRLAGLIACDTRAASDTEAVARGRRIQAEQIRLEQSGSTGTAGNEAIADAMIPKLFTAENITRLSTDVEDLRQAIISTSPESIAQGQLAMANRPDASAWLKQIQVPTLFVVGEQDQITPPAEMEQMSREVAGSKFVEIANAGHLPQIEAPEAFNKAVVEFLTLFGFQT